MITIANAQMYSMNNGAQVAYEIEYSEGTKVRSVVSAGGWIQKQGKVVGGEWTSYQKAYIVNKNKTRQGERIIESVKEWLK